jgi:hypothetical protein
MATPPAPARSASPAPALVSPPESALPLAALFAPLLLESSNGFAVLDAAGRYAYVSASMCNLLSLDKEALLGCVNSRCAAPRRTHGTCRFLRCALPVATVAPELRARAAAARPRRVGAPRRSWWRSTTAAR